MLFYVTFNISIGYNRFIEERRDLLFITAVTARFIEERRDLLFIMAVTARFIEERRDLLFITAVLFV